MARDLTSGSCSELESRCSRVILVNVIRNLLGRICPTITSKTFGPSPFHFFADPLKKSPYLYIPCCNDRLLQQLPWPLPFKSNAAMNKADLQQIRRTALHRELCRRGKKQHQHAKMRASSARIGSPSSPVSSPSSPSGRRRNHKAKSLDSTRVAELKKQVLNSLVQKSATTDRLGERSLLSIESHKSSIAEMRPARRKIKWNNSTYSDTWDPNRSIGDLQLDDLQIHGKSNVASGNVSATSSSTPSSPRRSVGHNSEGQSSPSRSNAGKNSPGRRKSNTAAPNEQLMQEFGRNPGQHIDALERGIRSCCATLNRVEQETLDLDNQAIALRKSNQKLTDQLQSMPATPRTMSYKQSHQQLSSTVERLTSKLQELDNQIGILIQQKKSVVADSEVLQEIVQHADDDGDELRRQDEYQIEDVPRYSSDEESDIRSILSGDLTMDGNPNAFLYDLPLVAESRYNAWRSAHGSSSERRTRQELDGGHNRQSLPSRGENGGPQSSWMLKSATPAAA